MTDIVAAVVLRGNKAIMRECWINVYHYYNPPYHDHYFVGEQKFVSREQATFYLPSAGLEVAYRIHVRMK